jgi:hypothetical protein
VDIAIKFSSKLEPAFSGGNITQQEQTLSSSISDFENMIGATKELSIAAFDQFCERISLL